MSEVAERKWKKESRATEKESQEKERRAKILITALERGLSAEQAKAWINLM